MNEKLQLWTTPDWSFGTTDWHENRMTTDNWFRKESPWKTVTTEGGKCVFPTSYASDTENHAQAIS